MHRRFLPVVALALAGCAGISTRSFRALGPERDRPVALAPPESGSELDAAAHAGVATGLARAGLETVPAGDPDALVLRVRVLDEREELAGGEALRTLGELLGGGARAAVDVLQAGSRAYNAQRVRLALVLEDPRRRRATGALFWDGFAGIDPAVTARQAGEESGEGAAQEIATQRERWFTRRIGDERLLLTTTPNLIPPGEWVLSNDEAFVFHLGGGLSDWLQSDLTLGALPVPVAAAGAIAGGEGIAAGGVAGFGLVGVLSLGAKVKVLEEGPFWPGIAASYDMVNVWGGALGAGGVVLLGKGVGAAGAGGAAALNLQFNLLTASAAKHFFDWLQVGTGLYVLDNHHFIPQTTTFAVADTFGNSATGSIRITHRFPTVTVPWISAEAAAGDHVRFVSEYLFSPGNGWLSLGARTLLYRTRFGLARAGHVAVKLDTAVLFTRYWDTHRARERTVALPWLGLAFYLR